MSPQDVWLFMHWSGNDCAYEFSWELGGGCMCQRRPWGEFEEWMTSCLYFRIFQFDKYWLDVVEETDYFSHWLFEKKTTAIYFMHLTFHKDDWQAGLACCSSWGRKESDTTERLNWTELKDDCANNDWTSLFSFHSFWTRQEVPLDHISFLF